jgi:uncharacterized protein YndB with AHSA1/START domain
MPRTDTASRLIAASAERVYAALVEPEQLLAWLPPQGMTARFEHFEVRPGGSYRLVLTYQDAGHGRGKTTADSDVVEARYVDLVPDVRVVQEIDFESGDPSFAGSMTMTWHLSAVDMASSLANLAEHLEA